MTKYVVSGYIGFDNFGDEAIAHVLVDKLKSKDAEKITLISSNPEKKTLSTFPYSTDVQLKVMHSPFSKGGQKILSRYASTTSWHLEKPYLPKTRFF